MINRKPHHVGQAGPSDAAKGFTLLELLVVIAVIGLLIAILLPALSMMQQHAGDTQCMIKLRQIGTAMEAYADDADGFYPRALPLAPGADPDKPEDWLEPWPSDICPIFWQSCYPSHIASYMDMAVTDRFDLFGLPAQLGTQALTNAFKCPNNQIPATALDQRKCGLVLDYGLANQVSQNRRDWIGPSDFLAADMTWALGYVKDSGGPNSEPELNGWWVPFVHTGQMANIVRRDLAVQAVTKPQFIDAYTTDSPETDSL